MATVRFAPVRIPQKGMLEQDSDKQSAFIAGKVLEAVSKVDFYTMLACYAKYKDEITREERQGAKLSFLQQKLELE